MIRSVRVLLCAVVFLSMAGCAGHPVQTGIYTPYSRESMMTEIRQKVTELGYTIQRLDTVNYALVADRPLNPPIDGADREELSITISPDNTGSTKLLVTAARIIPATPERPLKRVTASARTNADANAVIQMYMKARKKGNTPG